VAAGDFAAEAAGCEVEEAQLAALEVLCLVALYIWMDHSRHHLHPRGLLHCGLEVAQAESAALHEARLWIDDSELGAVEAEALHVVVMAAMVEYHEVWLASELRTALHRQ
jgi:hypothetical protein